MNKLIFAAIKQYDASANKKDVFNEFKDKIDKKVLAHHLGILPDKELSQKYDLFNSIFCIYLSLILISSIIFSIIILTKSNTLINNLLYVVLAFLFGIMEIYLVFKKNALIYRILVLGGLVLVVSGFYYYSNDVGKNLIISVPSLIIIAASLFLGIKMFPYFGIVNCKKDAMGEFIYSTEIEKKNENQL